MDLKVSLLCLFKGLTKSQIQPTNDLVIVKGQKSVWSLLMYVLKVVCLVSKRYFLGVLIFLILTLNVKHLFQLERERGLMTHQQK